MDDLGPEETFSVQCQSESAGKALGASFVNVFPEGEGLWGEPTPEVGKSTGRLVFGRNGTFVFEDKGVISLSFNEVQVAKEAVLEAKRFLTALAPESEVSQWLRTHVLSQRDDHCVPEASILSRYYRFETAPDAPKKAEVPWKGRILPANIPLGSLKSFCFPEDVWSSQVIRLPVEFSLSEEVKDAGAQASWWSRPRLLKSFMSKGKKSGTSVTRPSLAVEALPA